MSVKSQYFLAIFILDRVVDLNFFSDFGACLNCKTLILIGEGYADLNPCQDIDAAACKLMAERDPHLCTNIALAQTTCPKFCNLCPLRCYMCETPSQQTTTCNQTTVCKIEEHCYHRTVTSSIDGHVEHTMGCATPLQCDGVMGLSHSNVIGKRDVSYTCCRSDLCNHQSDQTTITTTTLPTTTSTPRTSLSTKPATVATTTPATVQCTRDVLFMMSLSRSISTSNSHKVIDFIAQIIQQFKVNTASSLFAVATYGSDVHTLVAFNDYRTKSELLLSLNNVRDFHGHSINRIDYNDVIKYVTNHKTDGDRPGVPTKTIIFVDHVDYNGYLSTIRHGHFPHFGDDVAVVTIGIQGSFETLSYLAADSNHRLHVNGYDNMSSIESQILSLICSN